MEQTIKRMVSFILAVIMLVSVSPFLAGMVSADSVKSGSGTWITDRLTYTWSADSDGISDNGATGSVSVSDGTMTVTAKNSKYVDGCGSNTPAQPTTTTVTVTNASDYPLLVTSLNTSGEAVSTIKQGDMIAPNGTFTITVFAPAVSNSTEVEGTVAIAVEEQRNVTVTFAPSPYVGYTVNGLNVAQNGTEQTYTTEVGTTISLPSVTAPDGYEFMGWRVGGAIVTESSFEVNNACMVFPVIVSAGADLNGDNFKVGSSTYTFWEDAVTAAMTENPKVIVVNATEVTLPANVLDNLLPASGGTYVKPTESGVEYILPAGVTLQVPYSTATTMHTTAPAYGFQEHEVPTAFRTMTVPSGAKLTVNGSISVDSYVCAYGQNAASWNGTPSGPHGKIVMRTGSQMELNSGANLYCYGYISGDGNVIANSGAKVYELFQLRCWRGGSATSGMQSSTRVFPMNQYYVQNIEAPITFYKGATEYVWSAVNASSKAYPTESIEFIGTNGMFRLTGDNNDSVTKRYHANVDRLEVAVDGNMELNALNVTIPTDLLLIGTLEMKSSAYVLPINNMNIVIRRGTTSIASTQTYGVAFLPGAKLTVAEGATFEANAPTYFYSADDWGEYGAGGARIVPVGYSAANGTAAIRTADNLKDAELDVNGTVTVGNKLYTTAGGANITSSTGSGKIQFTSGCATGEATTRQVTQSGTAITYDEITCNNAWLKNGDESYSKTVSTGRSSWFYDKDGEHWYRYLVDFKFNGNTISSGYYCENNDTVTYDASWLTDLSASATNGTATVDGTNINVTNVTANSTVTLTGVPAEYLPTFVLNEKQYSIYQHYTGKTISTTTTIGGETYYVVDQGSALAVGTAYAAPTDEDMGVTPENHNAFLWNLSGLSFTSGDPYRGTVPAGETAQGPAYIYGFYSGVVAYNSYTNDYYPTLGAAFEVLPQDVSATVTLLADCGTFEEENQTAAYAAYPENNITLDLNGYHAVGRIVNKGTFTLELNGGSLDCHTGATAANAAYKQMAAITNSGTMTVCDSIGGGVITTDAISSASGADGSAVIRNNAGAMLTVNGCADGDMLKLAHTQDVNTYNYGIYNLGTITALTNVDISTAQSGSAGYNIYNVDTGVIDLISGGHMFNYSGYSIFNYGGKITTIDGLSIDGKNGINNRNKRGSSTIANGYDIAYYGEIGTVTNSDIEVGQYAVYNGGKITTLSNTTFIAHPDSAQVDTRGDGLTTVSEGTTYAYAIYNSNTWWYDASVWKRTNVTSELERTDEYKEGEEYRPTITNITDCKVYGENTSSSATYSYALYNNGGIIGTISGGEIKAYKHPNNASKITANYALYNTGGGIIRSITGEVTISATGYGAIANDGQFTTKTVNTYGDSIGGKVQLHNITTYGQPSEITSITASGTITAGNYYALFNSGYVGNISGGATYTAIYNVIYNSGAGASTRYEHTRTYEDNTDDATETKRVEVYTRNLDRGGVINTIDGIHVSGKGTDSYFLLQNQGYIGTLSNSDFTDANKAGESYAAILNGDGRQKKYTLTREPETSGDAFVTPYEYLYEYDAENPPTINLIDNITVTKEATYAFRNLGKINTLKNSTITGTQYVFVNASNGPYNTRRDSIRYYSGATKFSTTKNNGSELTYHYTRAAAEVGTIDNCTITGTSTYTIYNGGHLGTLTNSTISSEATNVLYNGGSSVQAYDYNLLDIVSYAVDANAFTLTLTYGANNESKVTTTDYAVPVIDLIGEGNSISGTHQVVVNLGTITAIDGGSNPSVITSTTQKQIGGIYNNTGTLKKRIATTPYTEGTAGTTTNNDTSYSGAYIGSIKNTIINANGYGIQNGSAKASYLPVINELGEGLEINANCTTAGYSAVYNTTNAKIAAISGGIYTVTKATTYAYKNNYVSPDHATVISGGDFKGASSTRANAIFDPDNTNRQTYPEKSTLSNTTESVTLHDGTTATGYYFIKTNTDVTVTWKNEDGTVLKTDEHVASGTTPAYTGSTPTKAADATNHYTFSGWTPNPAAVTENTVYTAVFTATAHTWNEGAVTTAPTCTANGEKTRTCTVCDAKKTESISALGHDIVTDAAVPATCTEAGLTEGSHCTRCDYVVAQDVIPVLGHEFVDHAAQAATCTEIGWDAYQTCSSCDYTTYVEIPATGSHSYEDGACKFCGKAEEIKGLKIKSAYLKLNQNINILFNAEVDENMQNPYMVVTFNEAEYTLQSSGKDARGYLVFEFTNISPNMMGDTICATLYATDSSGNPVCTSLRDYSIRKYCRNLQLSYPDNAALQKLLNDVLVYGAAAQKYTGHKTDDLVTDQPVVFDPPESSALNFVGTEDKQYRWNCAKLTLDNAVTVCLTLSAAPGATVEVSVNDRKQVFCYADIVTDDPNVCVVNFRNLSPVEFGDTITAVIKVDGKQVGQRLEYSVNSYVYDMYNYAADPALAELLQALYNYGESVKSYFKDK